MNLPLVSIIIPTYNHANYLLKAIESVFNQSFRNFEVIVLDDGSTDHTKEVIKEFSEVTYIYQKNEGLSAARNNAISYSKGEFLIFLDADDWLYPDALKIQLKYFEKSPDISLVSGGHMKVDVDKNILTNNSGVDIFEENFLMLLKYNYIAHPGAAMFRRELFQHYKFDLNLKSCQDYDIYLKIARNHKVLHHREFVSAYRLHSSNMSSNYAYMLMEILEVLQRHKPHIVSENERGAYKDGRELVINFYTKALYWDKLRKHKIKATPEELTILRKYTPVLYVKYIGNYILKR